MVRVMGGGSDGKEMESFFRSIALLEKIIFEDDLGNEMKGWEMNRVI